MLRNSHGVGIAPPAADRDELDGGMTMMKGMMVTSSMRGRKNKASKAEGCKATRGPAFLLFRDLLHRAMPGRSFSLWPRGRSSAILGLKALCSPAKES